jgi:hypothetical protein
MALPGNKPILALQLIKNAFAKRKISKDIQKPVALLHLSRKHRNIQKSLRSIDKQKGKKQKLLTQRKLMQ